MIEKLVVLNIGWMQNYQGLNNDPIKGGGGYVDENKCGYEMFNFLPFKGHMYGFVQPVGRKETPFLERKINIQNIEQRGNASSFATDVLVAWVARNPQTGGTFLVGWYENAIVFRNHQLAPARSNRIFTNEEFGYYVKAKAIDCVLLSLGERRLSVPRATTSNGDGGIGQSNVWYANSGKRSDLKFRHELHQFIENYKRHNFSEGALFFPGEVLEGQSFPEGSTRRILINAYERNPQARKLCIEYYGTSCSICDFNFEDRYGEVGIGYIHVHHLKPLSEPRERYNIDPIEDLRPVCPNCHAIVHKRQPPYSIEEIKAFLA